MWLVIVILKKIVIYYIVILSDVIYFLVYDNIILVQAFIMKISYINIIYFDITLYINYFCELY
jgi:hypothetical protein